MRLGSVNINVSNVLDFLGDQVSSGVLENLRQNQQQSLLAGPWGNDTFLTAGIAGDRRVSTGATDFLIAGSRIGDGHLALVTHAPSRLITEAKGFQLRGRAATWPGHFAMVTGDRQILVGARKLVEASSAGESTLYGVSGVGNLYEGAAFLAMLMANGQKSYYPALDAILDFGEQAELATQDFLSSSVGDHLGHYKNDLGQMAAIIRFMTSSGCQTVGEFLIVAEGVDKADPSLSPVRDLRLRLVSQLKDLIKRSQVAEFAAADKAMAKSA